jgi:hypothetical protein
LKGGKQTGRAGANDQYIIEGHEVLSVEIKGILHPDRIKTKGKIRSRIDMKKQ